MRNAIKPQVPSLCSWYKQASLSELSVFKCDSHGFYFYFKGYTLHFPLKRVCKIYSRVVKSFQGSEVTC